MMAIEPERAHSPALIRNALRNCRAFANASPERIDLIARACTLRHYSRGTQILTGEGADRQVLLAVSGLMEVSQTSAAGKRFVMNLVGPGELAGLIRLFDDPPVTYGYIARERSAVVHLPCVALIDVLDIDLMQWRAMAEFALERKVLALTTVLDQAVIGPAEHRIAATIRRLSRNFGIQAENGTQIRLRLSQDDLADMLCVSRQTVNKELQRLEKEGVIRCAYNSVTIIDAAALQRIVDSQR